jgi:hypothetical protein
LMAYLRVKNWVEFQHYKDRNPPWIKLHRTLLDDYEFSRLQDASKAHLMLIWLFASQRDGLVPDDPKFLKMKLGLEKEPNLKWFINHGLLIPEQVASNALADCEQVAPREEERRGESDGPVKKANGHKRNGESLAPSQFEITEPMWSWAREQGVPHARVETETAKFLDHHKAKGSKFADWDAAWRKWMRNSVEFAGRAH